MVVQIIQLHLVAYSNYTILIFCLVIIGIIYSRFWFGAQNTWRMDLYIYARGGQEQMWWSVPEIQNSNFCNFWKKLECIWKKLDSAVTYFLNSGASFLSGTATATDLNKENHENKGFRISPLRQIRWIPLKKLEA